MCACHICAKLKFSVGVYVGGTINLTICLAITACMAIIVIHTHFLP